MTQIMKPTFSNPEWTVPEHLRPLRTFPTASRSESQQHLEQAILAFHSKLQPAEAKEQGQIQERTYRYADLFADLNACRSLLCEHGLVLTQWTVGHTDLVIIMTRLSHPESGEYRESDFYLKPAGSHPRDWGAATSYARRYALEVMVGLSKVQDTDAGGANGAIREVPRAAVEPGDSPRKQLFFELQEYAKLRMEDMAGAMLLIAKEIDKGRKKPIMTPTVVDGSLSYTDEQRRKALAWVREKRSSNVCWSDLFTLDQLLAASAAAGQKPSSQPA